MVAPLPFTKGDELWNKLENEECHRYGEMVQFWSPSTTGHFMIYSFRSLLFNLCMVAIDLLSIHFSSAALYFFFKSSVIIHLLKRNTFLKTA